MSERRMVRQAPQRAGEPAEEQGAAEGDELHEQDERDELALVEAELLGAVEAARA